MRRTLLFQGFALCCLLAAGCTCDALFRPALLAEGEPCEEDLQCESGLCGGAPAEPALCIRLCASGCRPLEVCVALRPETYGCLPERAGLCRPCTGDSECPFPQDRCLLFGGDGATEGFCGRDCTFDRACPEGYVCGDGVGLDGGAATSQCLPRSGSCACSDFTAGQTIPCEAANDLGRCAGLQTCQPPTGYGPCDAPEPAAERCNGLDDDCDGLIDEGITDVRCGVGDCERSATSCVDGRPRGCTPGEPAAEQCDGRDNDCDGVVDDGFDLMGDVANCGACGAVCALDHAVARCAAGRCAVDHCQPGFTDHDGAPVNGCEYVCVPSNGGVERCDALDNDCNGIVDDGFDLASSPSHCGACNHACAVPGGHVGAFLCTTGNCGIAFCAPGFGNCDGLYANGCETALGSDVNACGACGRVCGGPHATGACTAGQCSLTCQPFFWNLDGAAANGCEYACAPTHNGVEACDGLDNDCDGAIDEGFDLTSDPANCGACRRVCAAPNASGYACVMSACRLTGCQPGFADCNGAYADGCEVDTTTSVASCGACGNACAAPNATTSCSGGQCGLLACTGGFRDCNGLYADGCEVNSRTDVMNCGACGNVCSFAGATAQCGGGACSYTCLPGQVDLDGNPANGCEYACAPTGAEVCDGRDNDCDGAIDEGFDLAVDPLNCGACGNACMAPRASTYACTGGACAVLTCQPGSGDCNGQFADGCEVDTQTTVANCGACGNACALPNATPWCSAGACGVAACNPGFADCNALPADGCEVNIAGDVNNCGGCGNVCSFPNAAPSCGAGACAYACLPGFWDLDGSAANGCEYACTQTGAEVCDSTDNDCDGAIDEGFDLANDPANCGACNNVCTAPNAASYRCSSGTCGVLTCSAGFADCDGQFADGCEVNTTNDVNNCGGCGNACSFPHAAPSCGASTCEYTCLPGFWDLDGRGANGCEYACTRTGAEVCDSTDNDCDGAVDEGFDLASDPDNCGTCNNVCTAPNAASYRCTSGACGVLTCSAGFADCDGRFADGCEVNTAGDVNNCGSCGNVCSFSNAVPSCSSSSCEYTCLPGFWDLDGRGANGCEYACTRTGAEVCDSTDNDCDGAVDEGFDLASDPDNCGACNNVCAAANAASYRCTGGACGVQTCSAGFADCDGRFTNGCEVNTAGDVNNCGSCGNTCSFANAAASCTSSTCRYTCLPGFYDLDGSGANGCEYACTPTGTEVCDGRDNDCDGAIDEGFNLSSDTANCGACNNVCSAPHGGTYACTMGSCSLVTCQTGFTDCNGSYTDGCETNTGTATNSCGACGNVCVTPNATPRCTNGSCRVQTCNIGFRDCNNVASDGCEINTNTDTRNCGSCGRGCPASAPTCTGGVCR